MTSTDVLAMYENVAGLTNKMAMAARMSDWDGLDRLENQVAVATSSAATGARLPAQSGDARQRKVDLLKQILANDRAIRDVTEPWLNRMPGMAQ
jgi:flagellar protein FliT